MELRQSASRREHGRSHPGHPSPSQNRVQPTESSETCSSRGLWRKRERVGMVVSEWCASERVVGSVNSVCVQERKEVLPHTHAHHTDTHLHTPIHTDIHLPTTDIYAIHTSHHMQNTKRHTLSCGEHALNLSYPLASVSPRKHMISCSANTTHTRTQPLERERERERDEGEQNTHTHTYPGRCTS
jgi:hypothetical protein